VRLLEQVTRQACVGLIGVPRTPARPPEPAHHADEIEQPVATPGRGDGPLRDVSEEVVLVGVHGLGELAPLAPVAPPPALVLPVAAVAPVGPVEGETAVERTGTISPVV